VARRAAQTIDPRTQGAGYGSGYGTGHQGYPRSPSRGRRRIIDYPRYGRSGWRRWVPSWKLVLSLMMIGFLAVVTVLVAAYAATSIPQKDPFATAQSSSVYYSNGQLVGQYPGPNRRAVPLAQVPLHLQHAVLSAEDRSFYSNNGISLRGTVRAAVNDVRGRSLQGGSTITQQYVKNYFDLRDRTLARKAKEFFIALKINRDVPKPTILASYLNAIYMGRNAYGVQAAAQVYFGKDVSKLTVSESAFLAGIINGPELYDPSDGTQSRLRAQARWTYVMNGMVTEGWLSPADRAAQKFPTVLNPPKKSNSRAGQVGYLMDMVTKEMATRLKVSEQDLETKGYKITTTFDPVMIKKAAATVADGPTLTPKQSAKGALRIGVATVDPSTGAVRAIYGGQDYLKQQLNDATQNIAQAGSTAKVFGLIAALQYGVDGKPLSLRSRFDGHSPRRVTGFPKKVQNFGGEQFGFIDLTTATEHSVNTVYAQLNEKIGAKETLLAATQAGIPAADDFGPYAANVLGTGSVHPIDLASAYATIAAGGIYRKPFVVNTIAPIGGGKLIFAAGKPKGTRVFDEGVMADVSYAMQQVVKHGTATTVRQLGRPVAGKTGTSSDNMSAWFVGFTPQLSTAVGLWRQDPKTNAYVPLVDVLGKNEVTGGSVPAQLWTDYMSRALDGKSIIDFPGPVYGGDTFNAAPPPAPSPTFTATGTPTGTPTGSPTGTATRTPTGTPTGTSTGKPTATSTKPSGPPTRTTKPPSTKPVP
jgi:membrane peptidoglycan carboxypeptidase